MLDQTKLKVATYLTIAQCLALLLYPLPEMTAGHLYYEHWPQHAKFHVLWAAGMLIFICLTTMWQAWFHLQKGHAFAWWFILGFVAFTQGSVIVAKYLYVGGPSWPLALLGVISPALALAISASVIFKKTEIHT